MHTGLRECASSQQKKQYKPQLARYSYPSIHTHKSSFISSIDTQFHLKQFHLFPNQQHDHTMSAEYKGQNPLDIAKEAEKDLNSYANVHGTDPNTANPKHGAGVSDSGTFLPNLHC